jgi:uncharacterized cofD-like protein
MAVRTRAVAVGGGHGLARTLRALPEVVDDVTAVVTVADDGGSSGRLRRDLGVLPPGDLRMALTALARNRRMADVLQYRFGQGELGGHSLGNLVLVAMQELADGDLQGALDELATALDVPGRVLPCTTAPVVLHARTAAGPVTGQAAVASTPGIEQIWLDPAPPAVDPAVQRAIAAADLLVLGPGSLYTSLLPNLLVPGLAEALTAAPAPVVLVANLREQPGETQGLDLADHLRALREHAPALHLDVLVAHDGHPPVAGVPLRPDRAASHVHRVVTTSLADDGDAHDPVALARTFGGLLAERRGG